VDNIFFVIAVGGTTKQPHAFKASILLAVAALRSQLTKFYKESRFLPLSAIVCVLFKNKL